MRVANALAIVATAYLGLLPCSASGGPACDPRPPGVGHIVTETISPMCSAELPWGPAVIVVFAADRSGAVTRNAVVCAWPKGTAKALRAKADASGVVHLAMRGEGAYEIRVSYTGYREFYARQVNTKPGCVTWVHAVMDVPAME